jgi:CheY-like chemotaxis protein
MLSGDGFQRKQYQVALVGEEALGHQELLERAGYATVGAKNGEEAATLFSGMEIIDVVVLDFAISGRPPEAILLFARDVLTSAPLIGLVPANKDEGFRRAFMAGARDVLPSPTRGEDLLDAIDLVLEPQYLAEMVARLSGEHSTEGRAYDRTDPADHVAHVEALQLEKERLRKMLTDTEKAHQDELTRMDQDLSSMRNAWRDLQGKEVQSRRENNALERQLREKERELEKSRTDAKEERQRAERLKKERDRSRDDLDELRQEIALLEQEATADEPPHRLSRSSADLILKADLQRKDDEQAELRGRLDAVSTERDGLARQVKEAQRELADAETRLDELAGAMEEVESIRNELRAEKAAHALTRHRSESMSRVLNRAQREAAAAAEASMSGELATGHPEGFSEDALPLVDVSDDDLQAELARKPTVHDEPTISKYKPS